MKRFPSTSTDIAIGPDRFGAALYAARRGSGVSVVDLASATGLSPDYLYKLERGDSPAPAAERIEMIADALGVSPDGLFAAAGRICPDLLLALRDNMPEIAKLIRAVRKLGPAGLAYVNLRISMILDEIAPQVEFNDSGHQISSSAI